MNTEDQADKEGEGIEWHELLQRSRVIEAHWRAAGIAATPHIDAFGACAWIELDETDPDWGPTAHTRIYEAVASLLGVDYDGRNEADVHQALSALLRQNHRLAE